MGIQDREYYRDEGSSQGIQLRLPSTLIGKLIAINVLVFFATWFFPSIYDFIQLDPDVFRHPWKLPQLLSYGFVHAPVQELNNLDGGATRSNGIFHILFNMFALFVFGRNLETRYGHRELLVFYLTAIVLGGLLWSGYGLYDEKIPPLVGASGGVYAIAILFCLNYPQQVLLLFGVIPMRAWFVGIMIVVVDQLMGMFAEDNTAHSVHLAGAAFAWIYFQTGVKLARFVPRRRRGTSLKVHDPGQQLPPSRSERRLQKLFDQGDAILAKIQQHGEESLSSKERRTLERYSRKMRKRQGD
jgi:membrane associated rhomboid family serine protease